jgi:uncharacterized delta-60 repeat protein
LNPNDVAVGSGPNGKIVVAAPALDDGKFVVARYNANGTLDSTFAGGLIETDFTSSPNESAYAVVYGSDNKVILAGNGTSSSDHRLVALARYNNIGTLDTSYEQDGKVLQSSPGYTDAALFDVALDNASGKSFSGGYAVDSGTVYMYAERRDTMGNRDPSFHGDGRRLFANYPGVAYSAALAPSGRMILAGYKQGAGDDVSSVVLQLNAADGSLHSSKTFGTGYAYSVVADSSSRAVVAGMDFGSGAQRFVTSRVNTNGTLDGGFGSGGRAFLTIPGGSATTAWDLAIASDGKIVVVGVGLVGQVIEVVVARYKTDGTLDPTFDHDGIVLFPFANARASAVAIDDNGKIVVVASIHR